MRREGYELQVGQPQVIIREIDGVKCEPIESLIVDVPAESAGKVIELVTQGKGEMKVMEPKGDLQHLEFEIPSRGIIGLRNSVLTATAGERSEEHTPELQSLMPLAMAVFGLKKKTEITNSLSKYTRPTN